MRQELSLGLMGAAVFPLQEGSEGMAVKKLQYKIWKSNFSDKMSFGELWGNEFGQFKQKTAQLTARIFGKKQIDQNDFVKHRITDINLPEHLK